MLYKIWFLLLLLLLQTKSMSFYVAHSASITT